MPQNKRYSQEEINFIKSNALKISVEKIAETLDRSPKAIRAQIERLGIRLSKLERNKPHEWTEEEIRFLKENYQTVSDKNISISLGLPESVILRKRLSLDLRKHKYVPYIQADYYRIYIDGKRHWLHRVNAEKKLGRSLLPSEPVHHVDGNKLNNNPENLYICSDKQEHGRIHANLESIAFSLVQKGTIKFDEAKGKYYL